MKQNYTLKTLRLFYSSSPVLFLLVQFLTLLQGLMPFCSLIIFRLVIDRAGLKGELDKSILSLSVLWAGVFLFQHGASILNNSLREILTRKTLVSLNTKIMAKTLSFEGIQNFEDTEYREMDRRLDFCSNMIPYFLNCFTDASQYVLQCVSVFILFGDIGIWIPAAIILSLIPAILSQIKLARLELDFEAKISKTRMREMYLRRNAIDARFTKEFRVFNYFTVFNAQYAAVQNKLLSFTKQLQEKTVALNFAGILPRVLVAGLFLYFLFGKVVIGSGTIYTVGMLALYMQSVFIFSDAFLQIANWSTQVKRALHTIKFFFNYMEYKDSIKICDNPLPFNEDVKEIRFENVSFSYDKNRLVLKDVSCTVTTGEVLAIVGENGAGKTTLIKLLLRFYDATSGTIYVNGVDIKKYDVKQYRQKISAVFQDYAKFEFTLQENIDPGKESIQALTPEDINILGRSMYETLPEGPETMMGIEFGGRELSVGEWQRVAILRGLRKKSDIFIVDEPTASIDPIQEAAMYEQIIDHAARMTILITHRLGSVKKAKKILVLKGGKIIACDTHDALIRKCDYYAELYNTQACMYYSESV